MQPTCSHPAASRQTAAGTEVDREVGEREILRCALEPARGSGDRNPFLVEGARAAIGDVEIAGKVPIRQRPHLQIDLEIRRREALIERSHVEVLRAHRRLTHRQRFERRDNGIHLGHERRLAVDGDDLELREVTPDSGTNVIGILIAVAVKREHAIHRERRIDADSHAAFEDTELGFRALDREPVLLRVDPVGEFDCTRFDPRLAARVDELPDRRPVHRDRDRYAQRVGGLRGPLGLGERGDLEPCSLDLRDVNGVRPHQERDRLPLDLHFLGSDPEIGILVTGSADSYRAQQRTAQVLEHDGATSLLRELPRRPLQRLLAGGEPRGDENRHPQQNAEPLDDAEQALRHVRTGTRS